MDLVAFAQSHWPDVQFERARVNQDATVVLVSVDDAPEKIPVVLTGLEELFNDPEALAQIIESRIRNAIYTLSKKLLQ